MSNNTILIIIIIVICNLYLNKYQNRDAIVIKKSKNM